MKIAIMQPYFFPYPGYFQLIGSVDLFVLYDNIKYTKQTWINRNRILMNEAPLTVSLHLQKASDLLTVQERKIVDDDHRVRILNQIRGAYGKAPHFRNVIDLIEKTLDFSDLNLYSFVRHSIVALCEYIGISTPIIASSEIAIDHNLKNKDKVVAICQALKADKYVNAIGGQALYSKDEFSAHGIELYFIKSRPLHYTQFGTVFTPHLSIIDALMFVPLEDLQIHLTQNYDLI